MAGQGLICTNCGAANDAAARFCMQCGRPLEQAPPAPPAPQAAPDIERKVITALFCDVVGSTELAERLDPEDVDRLLRTYHALARRRIEAHGGTLEKFIGDAVLGVFGAPAVHEDDPARAVRASHLILRDLAASGLDLHVRIGIHTGEAVVRVAQDRPAEEGMATGDTLNTAARLQNVAPIDGVVASEQTYRRARGEFEWVDLGQVSVKGKAEPLQIWQPLDSPQAPRDDEQQEATPFLSRDAELAALVTAFDRAAGGSSIELVTIVAEAGMGKSRLIRELRREVRGRSPLVSWHQGRCLPYGDGISFWALGEIAKAFAGILETDDQATIGNKLDASLREPDPELRAWLRERVAPLVGLRTDMAPPPQEEAFTAWRRFVLALAATDPAVVVIEDLHWADPALVAFLVDLADSAPGVPLLLLVTARPEVAERHPGWLERAHRSTVVQLVSLGDQAITALVQSTIGEASPTLVQTVLQRAGGSPLYAEQLVALIRDRGLVAPDAALDPSVIPPTIQALLAARIDALPRSLKPALLDASVIGRVFWSGAVATLEGVDGATVATTLDDLARRELTRSMEPSTMLGEAEYGFWHALLRDVAYSFLPRDARLAKHRAAAAWITERVGGEPGDLAEIVADHQRRALELAEATGASETQDIRGDLGTALLAAAAHTMRVQPARAESQLDEALRLLADDDGRRGDALVELGRVLVAKSEFRAAAERFGAAQAWRADRGDMVAAAEAAVEHAHALVRAGDRALRDTVLAEARPTLIANPGPGLVRLLSDEALDLADHRAHDATLERADEAIALASRLGLPEPHRALFARATVRFQSGDRSAEAEIRRAISLALAAGNVRDALIGYGRIAGTLEDIATAAEALPVYDEALAFARDHGLNDFGTRAQRLDALEVAGMLDEILLETPSLRESALAAGDAWSAFMCDLMETSVHAARGEPAAGIESFATNALAVGFPASVAFGMPASDAVNRGDQAAAIALLERGLADTPQDEYTFGVADLTWDAIRLGDLDLARRLVAKGAPPTSTTSRGSLSILAGALLDEANGDVDAASAGFAQALAFFSARQWPYYMAFCLAGGGRCDLASGNRERGMARLNEAAEIAGRLRTAPLLHEIESAIAEASGREFHTT